MVEATFHVVVERSRKLSGTLDFTPDLFIENVFGRLVTFKRLIEFGLPTRDAAHIASRKNLLV